MPSALTPTINWFDSEKIRLRFTGSCLLQTKSHTIMEK